jgi:putative transposase
MIEQCQLSEWRACRLVGLSITSWREAPSLDEQTLALSARIVDLHIDVAGLAIAASTT